MFFDILTLFPGIFEGAFSDSIIKRAVDKGLIDINLRDIRAYSDDARHKTVDDYPYGGDAGMLMKVQPVADAVKSSRKRLKKYSPLVVFLSPQGERLTHHIVEEFCSEKAIILVCGRYKGFDERLLKKYCDRRISIGDYVLSGGEIPAMVVVDSVTRLIPDVLGDRESAEKDSFYEGILSPPQYTRPEVFENMSVPNVLLSGHHKKIKEWQERMALKNTRENRPDIIENINSDINC